MKKLVVSVLILLVLTAGLALAGEMVKVYCTDPKCGYTTDLTIGGGKRSPSITGYCPETRKFVRLKLDSWKQYRGQEYRSPQCPTPLEPIYGKEQISQFLCPKCGKLTLKAARAARFD